jgi:hypothetical protein
VGGHLARPRAPLVLSLLPLRGWPLVRSGYFSPPAKLGNFPHGTEPDGTERTSRAAEHSSRCRKQSRVAWTQKRPCRSLYERDPLWSVPTLDEAELTARPPSSLVSSLYPPSPGPFLPVLFPHPSPLRPLPGCVGKTSLVLRYCQNVFNDRHITTLQASFLTKRLNLGGKRVDLNIWVCIHYSPAPTLSFFRAALEPSARLPSLRLASHLTSQPLHQTAGVRSL